jgi:beta-galactosidase GanA
MRINQHSSFLAASILVGCSKATSSSFTYNNSTFLLNGEPYQIIGGQMDPQRIPYQYWSDRLYKARAMGLNTIFSYIFWDQIQPTPTIWDFAGRNNVAEYFRLAQEVGLHVVLRAGPYVCGEHEWGGFPAWLSEVPGMVVRSNNSEFLAASKTYLNRLADELRPVLVTNGGPIIMAQIENEYGSYGAEHTYTQALADMFKDAFGITLYTTDGEYEQDIVGGQIPDILAETDGTPQLGYSSRNQYAFASSMGPYLDGEYYVTWLDFWASNYTYETYVGDASSIATILSDLSWTLGNGSSFSIYMFHGGTNWGFQNGADWSNALEPVITSYDYGAPLDESGTITDIYLALREMISGFVPNGTIPALPAASTPIAILPILVTPAAGLFDSLPASTSSPSPKNMEALGQSHGFTLYRHYVITSTQGILQPGDMPRDRLLIYVNQTRVGLIDSIYEAPNKVNLTLHPGDILDLLVENMGRINYGPRIPDQRKGIVGNVTVGNTILSGWNMYTLPMDPPSIASVPGAAITTNSSAGPVFYKGTFNVENIGDTFLELQGWTKGAVWVNGINLGRYWIVGPQQTLYLPGCYLKERGNEIVILALEPSDNQGTVQGITTRNWGNNPDPDAP